MKLIPETREDVTIEWLSNKVFEKEQYRIQQVEWKGSVGDGLGMLSSLERLTVTYTLPGNPTPKSLNLVMKTLPKVQGTREFMLNEGLAQREYQMYAKVFPAWKAFMDNQNVPQESRFRHPQCYYKAESGEGLDYKMILLLEDLDKQEFSMWTPGFTKELGRHETKAVLTQLALFHAVGIAYQEAALQKNETYPQRFPFIGTAPYNKKCVAGFLKEGATKAIQEIVETDKENAPKGLKDDLEQLGTLEQIDSFPIALFSPKHSTILHHDLHANNVMFRDVSRHQFNNQPGGKEAVLLDFQCCEYSNPMKDVTFFLFLSCESRCLVDKTELLGLLRFYHNIINKALKQMASPVEYTLSEIQSDFENFSALTIIHILMGSLNWCFGSNTSENTKSRLRVALYHTYNTVGSLTNCFKPIHLRPGAGYLLPKPRASAFLLPKQQELRSTNYQNHSHSLLQAYSDLMLREKSKDQATSSRAITSLDFQCCSYWNPNKNTSGPVVFVILSYVYQCFLIKDRLQSFCGTLIPSTLLQAESTVDHFIQQVKNFWESSTVTLVLIIMSILSWCVGSNTTLILNQRSSSSSSNKRLIVTTNCQSSLTHKGLLPFAPNIYSAIVGSIYQRLLGQSSKSHSIDRNNGDIRFNDIPCDSSHPMLHSLPSAG